MQRKLITEKDNRTRISEEDKNLLWNLMPGWLKNPLEEGAMPMFYGTGSHQSDVNLRNKVKKILEIDD